jgi:hypothetical protein
VVACRVSFSEEGVKLMPDKGKSKSGGAKKKKAAKKK